MWKDYEYGGLQYRVSDSGEVFGCGRNRALKTRLNEDGYTSVTRGSGDKRRRECVHRIVARLFVDGYKDGYEVNHKDFDRTNNNASNLEWVSHTENVSKSAQVGHYGEGRHAGTNNGRAKVSPEDVVEIRKRYFEGESILGLSKEFGIGWTQTKRIVTGESWGSI